MEEYKLNGTDKTIIRQLTLMHLFLQHPSGLSFETIDQVIYNDSKSSSVDTHKRKFHRDREMLEESLGFYTYYDEESTNYAMDEAKSFVACEQNALSKEEKKMLRDVTIPHLLESYADQTDLIIALNKIGVPLAHTSKFLPPESSKIDFLRGALGIKYVIWNCYINRTTCSLIYTTAEGVSHTYKAQIWGTFSVAENQYFVANVSETEIPDVRTLRYDRVDQIDPLAGTNHYTIPEDYQDSTYLRLPFQIGDTLYSAQVLVEKERIEEFLSKYRQKGEVITQENGDLIWKVDVSDEDIFLFWCISLGLIPIEPKPLKDAFIQRLEKVAHNETK